MNLVNYLNSEQISSSHKTFAHINRATMVRILFFIASLLLKQKFMKDKQPVAKLSTETIKSGGAIKD